MWLDSLYLHILLSTQWIRGGGLSQLSGNLVLCVLISFDLRHDNRKISQQSCEIQCIITLLWFLSRGNMKRCAHSWESTSSKTKTKEVEIRISTKYILSLIISVFLLLTKVLNLTQPPTEISKNIYVPLEGYLIQAPHRKSRKMVQGSVYTHSILCVPPSERCAHALFHCSRVLCHLSTLVLSCRVCHTRWHIFLWKQSVLAEGGKGRHMPTSSSDSKLGSVCHLGAPR